VLVVDIALVADMVGTVAAEIAGQMCRMELDCFVQEYIRRHELVGSGLLLVPDILTCTAEFEVH